MKTLAGIYAWLTLAAVWIAAGMLYGVMPNRMATHWNAAGVANGYSDRVWGLFLLPIIMTAVQGLFGVILKIDPLRNNIEKFRKQYEQIVLVFALFMAYLFGVIVAWNMGIRFDMNRMLAPAFAGLFYGMGVLLKKTKRNWFIGIRTPWTMSSDEVWDKTHAIGGELFKLSGLIALFGMFVPQYAIALMIAPIVATSIGVVAYSYVIFRKQK